MFILITSPGTCFVGLPVSLLANVNNTGSPIPSSVRDDKGKHLQQPIEDREPHY